MVASVANSKHYLVVFAFVLGVLLLQSASAASPNVKPKKNQKEVTLYYETHGTGDPLLFIHGFGASSFTWRSFIEPLAPNHRLIMIDLKGFGRSPKPHDDFYEAEDQAKLVLKFITDRRLTNLTLIGHSFGGGVALITALKLMKEGSNRLKRLVLIDAAAYKQDLPDFIGVLRTPLIGRLALSLLSNKQKVRMILKESYYDDSKISDEQVNAYAAPLATKGATYALIRTAKSIVPRNIEQFAAQYKTINVPTLILWGRQDKVVPLQIGERLRTDINGSSLVIIEKCGHIPHEEKPDEAISAISVFLKANPTNDTTR